MVLLFLFVFYGKLNANYHVVDRTNEFIFWFFLFVFHSSPNLRIHSYVHTYLGSLCISREYMHNRLLVLNLCTFVAMSVNRKISTHFDASHSETGQLCWLILLSSVNSCIVNIAQTIIIIAYKIFLFTLLSHSPCLPIHLALSSISSTVAQLANTSERFFFILMRPTCNCFESKTEKRTNERAWNTASMVFDAEKNIRNNNNRSVQVKKNPNREERRKKK